MRARSVYALIHQDLRALVIPLAGSALILLSAIAVSLKHGSGPLPMHSTLWILFGMAMGSGLIARDRRSGSAAFFGSLPIHPTTLAGVRFVFRLLVALVFVAGFILLKYRFDMAYWGDGQGWNTPGLAIRIVMRLYEDLPGMLRNACMGTLVGLTLSAGFSTVVRRESVAFCVTFITILVAMILFIGVLMMHPQSSTLFSTLREYPWLWMALAVTGGLIAFIRGITAREPEQGQALRRVIFPLAITQISSMVLFAAIPFYLMQMPIEKMTFIHSVIQVPGTQDVLVEAGNELFSGGLWRVGTEGNHRVIDPEFRSIVCSPNGNYLAIIRDKPVLLRYLSNLDEIRLGYGNRYAEIRDVSGKLIRRESAGGFVQEAKWSPDEQWCAIPVSSISANGIKLIPSSAQKPCIFWQPDHDELSNYRVGFWIVGWMNDGSLIFCSNRWIPDKGCLTKLWRMVPGQKAEQIWEDDLWPYRVNVKGFLKAMAVIPRRNSIIMPHWAGPVPSDSAVHGVAPQNPVQIINGHLVPSNSAGMNRVTLREIFPDTGRVEVIGDTPLSGFNTDAEKRVIVWAETEAPSTGAQTILNVLNIDSREIRKIATSPIFEPDVSPDGRWVAATTYLSANGEPGLLLIDLASSEKPGTEGMAEQATKQATERTTEQAAKLTTEQVTDQTTEKVTERAAEQITEKVTERAVERITEHTRLITSWTESGQLLLMSGVLKKLGRLDPLTGDYEQILVLKGDR